MKKRAVDSIGGNLSPEEKRHLRLEVEDFNTEYARVLDSGEIIKLTTAGGGGFGNPEERTIEKVKEDLKNELISEDAANHFYRLKERQLK